MDDYRSVMRTRPRRSARVERVRFQPAADDAVDLAVTLGKPVPDREEPRRDCICPSQIGGISHEPVRAAFGVDAMQALVLAFHVLPTELRAIAQGVRFASERRRALGSHTRAACIWVTAWPADGPRPIHVIGAMVTVNACGCNT